MVGYGKGFRRLLGLLLLEICAMRKIFVSVFVCCAMGAIGQGKVLDSLYRNLEAYPKEDSTKVLMILEIAKAEFSNNPEKLLSLAKEALALSQKIGFERGEALSYHYHVFYYKSLGQVDEMADYTMRMLQVYEKMRNSRGLAETNSILGLIHYEWRDYGRAKFFLRNALVFNEKLQRKGPMATDYTNLASIFLKIEKYDSAIIYFDKALAIGEAMADSVRMVEAYSNLGTAYLNKKDYAVAIKYFEKSLPFAKRKNKVVVLTGSHAGLAQAYSKTGAYDKSEVHGRAVVAMAGKVKEKTMLRDAYSVLAVVESERGNFENAYQYLKLSHTYADSVFSESKVEQVKELEAKYETEKKQREIVELEQKARVEKLWRNSLMLVLFVTLVGATIIYLLQRSRSQKGKLLLEAQQTLNQHLQETDKIKSRFFANISHEFRTPLTLIISPIEEKLLAHELSQKEKISFQTIKRSANRLLELVNQLLDLSKLESGFMKLNTHPSNLYHTLMPIVSAFDSLADVGQVRYQKDIRCPEFVVLLDADKVEKVLNNLLSNAFKFSPIGGKVELKIVANEEGKSVRLSIEIKNASVIPLETLNRVFEPFFQGENAPVNGQQGTGLGLSLVQELVKLHGGTIRAWSKESEGTTFSVVLPLEKTESPAEARVVPLKTRRQGAKEWSVGTPTSDEGTPTSDEGSPTTDELAHTETVDKGKETILIVEDNQDVRNLIRMGLEGNYNILEASTGREGVELATEKPVDLIVSDVMMPVMSGVELCHLLKTDERTSHVPIILLTARADHESKLEGLRTGADDYVTKPFNMQELQARVVNLIGLRKKLIQKFNQQILVQPHEITVTPMDERFVQKLNKLIEDNLDNAQLTVEKVSEDMGMSRANLHRKIKAITGLSSSEFIQDFRLRRAAILIEKKADTITQIGYQVGFNDQSYFSKCFKKKFGMTPSEWGV
jgi:signal transduction histidine kinase/DNA-binding response OmpR family regulator